MLKTYVRNRFRVKNLRTQVYERLNVTLSSKNVWIMVAGFDTLADAEQALVNYQPNPEYRKFFRVESYPVHDKHEIEQPSEETNRILESRKVFSGKGLEYNTSIPRKDETKYSSDKYYTPEIRLAQSAFFNKGTSTIKGKVKREVYNATDVFQTLQGQRDHGSLSRGVCPVDGIRKRLKSGELTDRKSIKIYLKERGYTSRNTNRIICQVFDQTL